MMEDSHLIEAFTEFEVPPFPCPRCGASLTLVKDSLKVYGSADTRIHYDRGLISNHEGSGVFTMALECSSQTCREKVVATGKGYRDIVENPMGGDQPGWVLEPQYFQPAIKLFNLPRSCPKRVSDETISSFRSFWSDPSSSVNLLRKALECLMDELKVSATDSAGKMVSLHKRLEDFTKSEPIVGELLLAIKWVGNVGSHDSTISKEKVIEAYRIFEHALQELLENRSNSIQQIAKTIIQNRGH